jgi:hypothetical protein
VNPKAHRDLAGRISHANPARVKCESRAAPSAPCRRFTSAVRSPRAARSAWTGARLGSAGGGPSSGGQSTGRFDRGSRAGALRDGALEGEDASRPAAPPRAEDEDARLADQPAEAEALAGDAPAVRVPPVPRRRPGDEGARRGRRRLAPRPLPGNGAHDRRAPSTACSTGATPYRAIR